MSLWEYKLLSSKQTPFANLSVLESFLNALGKDQWEIISWRTAAENPLEFEALARRPAYKEWYLEGPLPQPVAPPPSRKKDDNLREIVLPEDAAGEEDESIWEEDDDDEAPENIFAAVKPFLRRTPQGNASAASLEILAEKFGVEERDLLNAFAEEGLRTPAGSGQRSEPVEHEGVLFWLNRNQRGQTWVNAKPKPREQPRPEPTVTDSEVPAEAAEPAANPEVAATESPETPAERAERTILDRIRPMMRRNKRGQGFSGSLDYLCRALKVEAAELVAQIEALGVKLPATADERLDAVAVGRFEWYFNRASNGQVWINGREKRPDRPQQPAAPSEDAGTQAPVEGSEIPPAPQAESAMTEPSGEIPPAAEAAAPALPENTPEPAPTEPADAAPTNVEVAESSQEEPLVEDDSEVSAAPSTGSPEDLAWLGSLRAHLRKARRGTGLSGEIGLLADVLNEPRLPIMERLVRCGLAVPEHPEASETPVEHDGQLFWLSRNAEEELLLNVKDKPKRSPRSRAGARRKPASTDAPVE